MLQINNKIYNWVPETKLEYETFSPPSWEYDIKPGILYRELAEVYQDEIKETILQFLKNKSNLDISKTDQIKVMLKYTDYTQQEIADRLGVNKSLITYAKKQM